MSYIRDPEEIYRASFSAIRAEIDLTKFPSELHSVVIRVVHACAMPDICDELVWAGTPTSSAIDALSRGKPIFVDAEMVKTGIQSNKLPPTTEIICTLNDAQVPDEAKASGTTRSACAVNHWLDRLEGAVVVIGNAPTALFQLLELLEVPSTPRPASIIAFPLGFIGAAESKEALIDAGLDVPFLTLRGRRGGSAMASAAVNALRPLEG